MAWDAILFDLDGTLWDASHITAEAWVRVQADHPEIRRSVDLETVQGLLGHTNEELAGILFPELPFSVGYGLIRESCGWELRLLREQGGHLYDGLQSTLEQLAARYPLGIISNCQTGYIEAFLAYHKLGHLFRDHICSGETMEPKWQNIRTLCDRQGFTQPVYIGDTLGDAAAASKAGCDFLWASYGFGDVPAEQRHGILQTPADIIQYMGRDSL